MPTDFNAFDSTPFNSFRDSGYNARGRTKPFTVRYWVLQQSFVTVDDAGTPHVFRAFAGGAFASTAWGFRRVRNALDPGNDIAAFGVNPGPVAGIAGWNPTGFNHVVGGFDGDNVWIQLNNSARATSPADGITPSIGGSLRLKGYSVNATAPYLDSTLDEIAIWNDRTLSEAEVAADWNGGAGVDYTGTSQGGLLAYWKMDAFAPGADQLTDEQAGYVLDWVPGLGGGARTIVAGQIGSAVKIDIVPITSGEGYFGLSSDDFSFHS